MNNNAFVRLVCRLLVASLVLLPLSSQAELIGTGQVQSATATATLRAGIEEQLVSFGLAREAAKERVAALSDAEIAQLQATGLEAAPAGAYSPLPLIVVALLIYFLIAKPSMEGKAAAKK